MANPKHVSSAGLAEIVGHEAIVQTPYKDSKGIWTWGVGHTRYAGAPDPARMKKGEAHPISDVMTQFRKDIRKYEAAVVRAVKVPISQHEFDALVSFHFNTGGIARASLTRKLNAGDRSGAAKAFMNWVKPPEITARRRSEMNLFRTGRYGDGMATVYPAISSGRVQWSKGRRVNVRDLMQNASAAPPAKPPSKPVTKGEGAVGAGTGAAAIGAASALGFDVGLAIFIGVVLAITALIVIRAIKN